MNNTGKITRSRNAKRYTPLSNDILQSKTMGLFTRGLLVYLLSLPEDWSIMKSNLHILVREKENPVDKAFKELQRLGYIVSTKTTNEKGQFVGWDHVVLDEPINTLPAHRPSEFPTSDFTDVGESDGIINNNIIGRQSRKEISFFGENQNLESVEAKGTPPTPISAPPPSSPETPPEAQDLWNKFIRFCQENEVRDIFKMPEPLTPVQLLKLYHHYNLYQQSNRDIFKQKILALDNDKKQLKEKKSTYKTIHNWLSMHRERNPSTLTSTTQPKPIVKILPDLQ